MSDLTDSITLRPWLTPAQLADVVADRDYLLGMLRTSDWGAPARAVGQGKTVYALLGGEPTAKLRQAWATYIHLAHQYRVIRAYYEAAGEPAEPVDEADYGDALRFWLRWGARRGWGDPHAAMVDRMSKMAEIPWGCYQAPAAAPE